MYSEQFMHYLYSYNMPKKEEKRAYLPDKSANENIQQHLRILKSAYATMPLDFQHK